MKGDPDVIAKLDEILTHELTSADLYLYFSRHLQDQGYTKLHARLAHEAQDEQLHAQRIVERILLLDGEPDVLARAKKPTPRDPKGILEASLDYELEVAELLNDGIRLCTERGDAGSRLILEDLLRDTEDDHIDWLEAQLHVIGEIGLELYLGEQV
ncbi:MAG: bacterioferritin [Myxococcales bacterium]|nr:bacterioferritin [Myxococcales bacterium]